VSHAATLRDLKLDLGVMCRVERICCLDLVRGVWTKIERKIERRWGEVGVAGAVHLTSSRSPDPLSRSLARAYLLSLLMHAVSQNVTELKMHL
jgi:hypothetical protein